LGLWRRRETYKLELPFMKAKVFGDGFLKYIDKDNKRCNGD
jgi:hypothetical protein